MKKEPSFGDLLKELPVQIYLVGTLMTVGLLVMMQMAKGQALLGILLFIIAVLGMFLNFAAAPVLVLLAVGGGELFMQQFYYYRPSYGGGYWVPNPIDFLQCLAMLGYLICQFRLHALTATLFPRDQRLRQEPSPKKPVPWARRPRLTQRRSPKVFPALEVGVLLMTLPLWGLAAFGVWAWLAQPRYILGLSEDMVRLTLLTWLLFLLLVLAAVPLAHWRWCYLSRDEALLFLQDTYWKETRREQRRQYRWLAWARHWGKYRKKVEL